MDLPNECINFIFDPRFDGKAMKEWLESVEELCPTIFFDIVVLAP
jgi:hypothetical protein